MTKPFLSRQNLQAPPAHYVAGLNSDQQAAYLLDKNNESEIQEINAINRIQQIINETLYPSTRIDYFNPKAKALELSRIHLKTDLEIAFRRGENTQTPTTISYTYEATFGVYTIEGRGADLNRVPLPTTEYTIDETPGKPSTVTLNNPSETRTTIVQYQAGMLAERDQIPKAIKEIINYRASGVFEEDKDIREELGKAIQATLYPYVKYSLAE